MRARFLIALYLAVLSLPLGMAWVIGGPPRSVIDELASGAGMLAFTIILVEFVLSGRFRAVSGGIGMDVTMRFHQLLARSALVLAIAHPFLYQAPSMRAYPWDASRQLTISDAFDALATGTVAWLLLPVFVLLSINRNALGFRYETWRLMHGIGAVLIAGFTLHHALSAGRYSQAPAVAGIWVALTAIAVFTLVHVYVVEPLRQRRHPWMVSSVRKVAQRTWEIALSPIGHGGLDYAAGQFVWLNVGHGSFSLRENPFSISSAPASGSMLRFIIKELGDFTAKIGQIEAGTSAYVDGPHGTLSIAGRTEPGIALIAGGVGIAPLMGILRQLRLEGDHRPTVLLYGNRLADQIVTRTELEDLARSHGTDLVHVLSEPGDGWQGRVGMVDGALIRDKFDTPDMKRWVFVICGPPAMIEAVEETLISIGVPARQILSERFSYD